MNKEQKITELENRLIKLEEGLFPTWSCSLNGHFSSFWVITNGKTTLKITGESIDVHNICEFLNTNKIKSI